MKKPTIITDTGEGIKNLSEFLNYNPKGPGIGFTVRDGQMVCHDTYEDMWHDTKNLCEAIYYDKVLSEEDIRVVIYYIYQKHGLLKNTGFGLEPF
jgi:hypothetical protein